MSLSGGLVYNLSRRGDGGPDSIQAVSSSFVHMYTNRLLRSAARAQELVLYDFLGRLYQSQKARG